MFLWPQRTGRYAIVFEEDNLGSYDSAISAASDASCGSTFSPPSGIDLGELGIPEDLVEWQRQTVSLEELLP